MSEESNHGRIVQMSQKKKPGKDGLSRPVISRSIDLDTLQMQRVLRRVFDQLSISLFSMEVVLRRMASRNEDVVRNLDQAEEAVVEIFDKINEDLQGDEERLRMIMEENGIREIPEYTAPVTFELEISSPYAGRFVSLVKKTDSLLKLVDALWINGVFSAKQHENAAYQWQRRLIKTANRVIGLDREMRSLIKKAQQAEQTEDERKTEKKPENKDSQQEETA